MGVVLLLQSHIFIMIVHSFLDAISAIPQTSPVAGYEIFFLVQPQFQKLNLFSLFLITYQSHFYFYFLFS